MPVHADKENSEGFSKPSVGVAEFERKIGKQSPDSLSPFSTLICASWAWFCEPAQLPGYSAA